MGGKGSEMEDPMKALSDLKVERDYYRQVAERLGQKALADAQDFSQMIRDLRQREMKLQQSREELEKTIEERTAELVTRNKDLSDSSVRYDSLVTRIPHGVYTLRVRGSGERQFDYVSPPFCRILDIDPEKVQCNAHLAFSTVYPEDREGLENSSRAANEHRVPFRWEGRFVIRQEVRWIKLEADLASTPTGDIVWNGVLSDITERKLVEEERERLQMQLTQAQKMEGIGQLAGGVAHDFNNMLGVIIGYSELILDDMDPSQRFRAELEEIQKAARRSADLTRQLLTFARKQTVAPRVLDLNQTVEGMLSMLRRLIGENINLMWMPGNGLWPIKMDPSQIDQILANLCVNARDAIAGVGKITVATENTSLTEEYCATHAGSMPGEYVRIAVSDTGNGMDKETLAHIFEPFFTTKGVGKGTGLGLATVYGAVKQNNGFINVCSEPGRGTTFTTYIPRYMDKIVPGAITDLDSA